MTSPRDRLAGVPPGDRILLLPHCLRLSGECQAKYSRLGLECAACNQHCAVNTLRSAALDHGYKGVCVAPGGRLAVKYVGDMRPGAIVAIACSKELDEGVDGLDGLNGDGYAPVVVMVPLSKDGCVDTEVDLDSALDTIALGCAK